VVGGDGLFEDIKVLLKSVVDVVVRDSGWWLYVDASRFDSTRVIMYIDVRRTTE
jgi:hypothetical protein